MENPTNVFKYKEPSKNRTKSQDDQYFNPDKRYFIVADGLAYHYCSQSAGKFNRFIRSSNLGSELIPLYINSL